MQRNKEFLIYFSVFLCGAMLIMTSIVNAGTIGNLLIYLCVYAICFMLSKTYLSHKDFNRSRVFSLNLQSLAIVSTFYLLLFFINIALSLLFHKETPDVRLSVWILIHSGLIIPVIEELFFRGCICTGLSKIYGKGVAIFISSLLFALLHTGTSGFIFAFIGGLIFSFLYMQTDSILPGLILHIANNFVSVLMLKYKITILFAPITALLLLFVFTVLCILKKKSFIMKTMTLNTDFLKSFNFYVTIIAIYFLKIIGERI